MINLTEEEQAALNYLIDKGLSDEEILRGVCEARGMPEQEFNLLLARCGGNVMTVAEYLDNKTATN